MTDSANQPIQPLDYAGGQEVVWALQRSSVLGAARRIALTSICFGLGAISLYVFGAGFDVIGFSEGHLNGDVATFALALTIPFVMAVIFGAIVDYAIHRSIDANFRPLLTRLRVSLRCFRSRLVYEAGFVVIVVFLACSQREYAVQLQMAWSVNGPPRLLLAGVCCWSFLWLGEAIARPARTGAIAAAIWLAVFLPVAYALSQLYFRR